MDLFKAYDCLAHDLFVAKLEEELTALLELRPSLQLISDYLS